MVDIWVQVQVKDVQGRAHNVVMIHRSRECGVHTCLSGGHTPVGDILGKYFHWLGCWTTATRFGNAALMTGESKRKASACGDRDSLRLKVG